MLVKLWACGRSSPGVPSSRPPVCTQSGSQPVRARSATTPENAEPASNGTERLELRTIPLDVDRELTVRLLDPTGQPVSDVPLQIHMPRGEYRPAHTGPDGRAQRSGLPALPLRPMFATWRPTREQRWLEPRFEQVTPEGQERTVQFRQGAVVEESSWARMGRPAWAGVLVVEGDRRVRSALAGEDGRFAAILDPEWTGKVSLRIDARGPNGEHVVAVAEDVRPGQEVMLRLESVAK